MIIWGIRSRQYNGGNLQELKCPGCKKRELSAYGILKYIHIFWIPMFIVSKKVKIQCSACHAEMNRKELQADHLRSLKKDIFTSTRTLSGNFGVLVLGTAAFIFIIMVISYM